MFGSTAIDVALGVVFIFLLLSLVASTVNEFILSLLNMRGKELLNGLKTLLDDDNGTGLVKDLYNHGQVYGLFKGLFDPKQTKNLPAYIPSQNFVMAILDIIPAKANPNGDARAAQLTPAELIAGLRDAAQKLAANPDTEKVGKSLMAMIDVSQNDLTKLKTHLEDWFNGAMDRVSGWYKHRTQNILFAVGLVLAVALNASTLNIVKQLSKDPTLRQTLVAAAQKATPPAQLPSDTANSSSSAAAGTQNDQAKQTSDATGQSGAAGSSTSSNQLKGELQKVESDIESLNSLGVPLGWTAWPQGSSEWFQLSIGWLLTAFAVSLGAPFWFDMLNKVMVVRSTIKPREKSQEEPSKD
jgi:hypothetical protein